MGARRRDLLLESTGYRKHQSSTMHYDLHCHSTHSDGLLAPAAVVARAAARGVDVLALTDHDDTAGLAEARRPRDAPASRSSAAPSCR